MTQKFRITYATLSADNEELQAAYDAAVDEAKTHLGSNVPIVINGKEEEGTTVYEERSPIDHDLVVARIQQASTDQVDRLCQRGMRRVELLCDEDELQRASSSTASMSARYDAAKSVTV